MMYRVNCPHCHYTLNSGHGVPFKYIGEPIRCCPICKKIYVDSNVYEWGALNPIYKFWFYFGANNRWIVFLLLFVFAGASHSNEKYGATIALIICIVLWILFCCIYVNSVYKYEIEESIERCKHEGYIKKLRDANYTKLYVKSKIIKTNSMVNDDEFRDLTKFEDEVVQTKYLSNDKHKEDM